ncbi:MAG: repeat protein [Chthonomonadaceae bacterium]|nr:repeat protein [Chthonomonadaceae bacterium]
MENGVWVLRRVLFWTGGNPYMTQRLCQAIAEAAHTKPWRGDDLEIDRLCAELFLTTSARASDDNLAFARSRLLQSDGDIVGVLELYQRVWSGYHIADDETNPLTSILKLSGVVRAEGGCLAIRNRIYRGMFDRKWVRDHMPDAELRRQRAAYHRGLVRAATVGTAGVSVLGALAFLAIYNAHIATRLAEERRIALVSALTEHNRAKREKERADIAAIAVKREHDRANAEAKRADREAKMAQEMAQAFAAQQPKRPVVQPVIQPAKRIVEDPGKPAPDEHSIPKPVESELSRPFWLFLLEPANAALITRSGVSQIDINAIDAFDWHVEAVHPIGTLVQGADYHLRFRARADTPRDMEINVQIDRGDYHSVVSPRPHARLSTAWQTFDFVVRPHDVGEYNQIAFFLGTKVGKVWLTDVSIE